MNHELEVFHTASVEVFAAYLSDRRTSILTLQRAKDERAFIAAAKAWLRERGVTRNKRDELAIHEIENDAIIGEGFREAPKHKGGQYKSTGSTLLPVLPPTYEELGIDKTDASRCQQLADIPQERREEYYEALKEAEQDITKTGILRQAAQLKGATRVTVLMGKEEYNTPKAYVELARQVLGTIDLDPASNALAQTIIQATTFYTAEDNGLIHDWAGTVWLNPPYAYPPVELFVRKTWESWLTGKVSAAIILVNNVTDTGWFQDAAHRSTAICFTRGRINFFTEGMEKSQPTQGQAFLYFGDDAEVFATHFRSVGIIMTRKGMYGTNTT